MPSPRWLARLTIPMMAGAALVSSTAIATANTPADDAYLANCAPSASPGRQTRKRHSSERRTSSATTSVGVGRPQQIADDIHDPLEQKGRHVVRRRNHGRRRTLDLLPR